MANLNRPIKVLILGNGFDLAHGLPTRYSDFLKFCDISLCLDYPEDLLEEKIDRSTKPDSFAGCDFIKNKINEEYGKKDNGILREIQSLIKGNVWLCFFDHLYNDQFFYTPQTAMAGNWVDFENEIRRVIEFADRADLDLDENASLLFNKYINKNKDFATVDERKLNVFTEDVISCLGDKKITLRTLRKYLYDNLEDFIKAFNLYLFYFVDSIPAKYIKNFAGAKNIISGIEKIKPNYVLSFNYTHTYEKLYPEAQVFHIHGECTEDCGKNNIVLGIDQYWKTEEERQEHVNYAIFKKYVQRIRNRTGNAHRIILDKLRTPIEPKNHHGRLLAPKAYVFGHSLNKTDKDILADFFNLEIESAGMKEDINITVFYHDKETEGELIANMVSLIGEEKVLEKSDKSRLRFIKLEELNI